MEINLVSIQNSQKQVRDFGREKAEQARSFHRTLAEYEPTPLVSLSHLAEKLGLQGLYVKDESKRFGLNAFKALGGIFAMHQLLDDPAEKKVFVTTTDGNHGRGVAWAGKRLGQEVHVYMPVGSARERAENIRKQGAHVEITDMQYDDCVRYTEKLSREKGWTLIQDTAWEGYEEIPALIMQGYTTMGLEIFDQLGDIRPTHVFLQAGVGSMAGALTGFLADVYGQMKPVITIVEPTGADCFFQTAKAADGTRHFARDLNSIMAGLCCGEPCTIAWDIIERYAEYVISCDDSVTEDGMRILGRPLEGDEGIISGESGAVTAGVVVKLMTEASCKNIRRQLGLDETSVVLCISTEGDTDRANYRRIMEYPV
jgi:diaminopropionate ammonia-lyase